MKKVNITVEIDKEEFKRKLDIQNGKDADESLIVKSVIKALTPMLPDKETPISLRDKLENLIDEEKLSIQAIQDLPSILEELKKIKKTIGGGVGGMNAGVFPLHFIDDETPVGTIDGANTDFTINLPPATGSLKLYRGGARQRITEDYTISGQTITFINAPQVGEIILCDYRV